MEDIEFKEREKWEKLSCIEIPFKEILFSYEYQNLNALQFGAAVRLMFYCATYSMYSNVDSHIGYINSDEDRLHRICDMSEKDWDLNKDEILSVFKKCEKGYYNEIIINQINNRYFPLKGKSFIDNAWGGDYVPYRTRSERLENARRKGTHTKKDWEEMKLFFENTCARCIGESKLNTVVKDHIVPICIQGSDAIQNIQPLCSSCNSGKGKDTKDYRLQLAKYLGKQLPDNYRLII